MPRRFRVGCPANGRTPLNRLNIALVWGLLVMAGCATYEPTQLDPVQTVARREARSLGQPELRPFLEKHLHRNFAEWPPRLWDLEMLTLAGFYYHPDLDLARSDLAVAEAGKVTAGERPNPSLGVAPGYNTTTGVPSPWILTPTFDLPIETAGKRTHRMAQADHVAEAARLKLASVAWQVRSRVRKGLLDVYAAQETMVLLAEQEVLQTETARLNNAQYQAGALSGNELTQSRLAANATRLAVIGAEQQEAEARVRLADAIGVPVRALKKVDLSFEMFRRIPGELPAAELRRQALWNRVDILGALADYAAAQSSLKLEIARQYPDVHLGPGYEYDQGDNRWTLGLSVTLPLFNHNQGGIAEARARLDQAIARFGAVQAQVLTEIDLATASYGIAVKKATSAASLVPDLQKQKQTARAMFDLGELSRNDWIRQQLELGSAALARTESWVAVHHAAGQLEDAIQSPIGWTSTLWQSAPRLSESVNQKDLP